MPLTRSIAACLGKILTDVRLFGDLWWLRLHSNTQVTFEDVQRANGSVEPSRAQFHRGRHGVGFLPQKCCIFRTPSTRTLSARWRGYRESNSQCSAT